MFSQRLKVSEIQNQFTPAAVHNEGAAVQRKLSIGAVNDPLEAEADAMADKVMRMPEPQLSPLSHSHGENKIQKQDNNTGPDEKEQKPEHSKLALQLPEPDFLSLRRPFFERNAIQLWDMDSAFNVWKFNLDFFKRLGLSESWAGKAANLTAPLAIDAQLKAANPTWWEITDRELNTTTRMLPIPAMFNFDANFRNWKFLPFLGDVQKKAMGSSAETVQRKCAKCEEEDRQLQKKSISPFIQAKQAESSATSEGAAQLIHATKGSGSSLDSATKTFMESRFGSDFSSVKIHADDSAAQMNRELNAQAFTVGRDIYFGNENFSPGTEEGRHLLAHELTHVLQQSLTGGQNENSLSPHSSLDTPIVQRRTAPYIKKITVHLTPPQSADLEWEGVPPVDASGSDNFTVSTGKGYSNPGDEPGTCHRTCCTDALTQCAPPWNNPTKVGACCTYYGDKYWTGTPLEEHNTWKWWTPIQPYYSTRGIALHQHTEVTGEPIGHGCVRMDEPNAKRIYDYSNGKKTNVTIDGRAAPVACEKDRLCSGSAGASGKQGSLGMNEADTETAGFSEENAEPVTGLEIA